MSAWHGAIPALFNQRAPIHVLQQGLVYLSCGILQGSGIQFLAFTDFYCV